MLTEFTDGWSMVVVGAWNPAIFSPTWINDQLISEENRTADVSMRFSALGGDREFVFDRAGVRIAIEGRRVRVRPILVSEDNLNAVNEVVCKLLRCLSHTPVSAAGVNVSFDSSVRPECLEPDLNYSESRIIELLVNNHPPSGQVRKYSIPHPDLTEASALNLELTEPADEEESCRIEFNFHFDHNASSPLSSLADRLEGRFIEAGTFARRVLTEELPLRVTENDNN